MYACVHEIGGGFFAEVCAPDDRPHISYDPPPTVSQFANWLRDCQSQKRRTGQMTYFLPRSLDQELRLRHKLINVVVEAVVYAVDIT